MERKAGQIVDIFRRFRGTFGPDRAHEAGLPSKIGTSSLKGKASYRDFALIFRLKHLGDASFT
jgi:hypothetical protein